MGTASHNSRDAAARPDERAQFFGLPQAAQGVETQLDTSRRQLESARQGPEILLVQRAMSETSDHLKILIEQTIRFHLRQSPAMREFMMDGFEHYQLAGLALLYLKNESKAETERDLVALIAAAANDLRERTRRERLLQYVRSTAETDIIELAKHSLTATGEYPGSSINSLPAEARH